MADRIVAQAKLDNGVSFAVELANFTEQSVFIITGRKLAFRENVSLAVDGVELRGEVVYLAQDDPRGAVVTFRPPVHGSAKLERWIERGEVLHAVAPDELWSDATEPAPELLVTTGSEVATVFEVETDEMNQQAVDPNEDTGIEVQLPELEDDGTLSFASPASFKAQYTTDILKGGLMARSPPLPIGTQKMIRVTIPGMAEVVAVSAHVGFVGGGTVGLMIDSFAKHKHVFDKLFEELP